MIYAAVVLAHEEIVSRVDAKAMLRSLADES